MVAGPRSRLDVPAAQLIAASAAGLVAAAAALAGLEWVAVPAALAAAALPALAVTLATVPRRGARTAAASTP